MTQGSDTDSDSQSQTPYSVLKRFVRPRAAIEQCDLCSEGIAPEHSHLIEPGTRQLLCACEACALLFDNRQGTKYVRVPRRVLSLQGFRLTDDQWDDLMIPVGMAFFFYNSTEGRMMAYYPSPAGPTESLLTLEAWEEVARDNPIVREMRPDVEAVLANRLGDAREYFLAPIDKCYELVGLIRTNWRGLSGGQEVWKEIARFFNQMRTRSEIVVVAEPEETSTSALPSREEYA